jgi:hypothetical protein
MDMEKNIIEIVNNVLHIIQKKEYYKKSFGVYDIDFKDLDNLWDFYRTTNKKYKKKYKEYNLDIEQSENNEKLSDILNNYPIFNTVFSLHTISEKSHIITFSISENDNIFILYKNTKNINDLPSNFICLTMPNPINNLDTPNNILNISCYFED